MSKWFAERSRDQRGFTLIEIMVVVAILAILAFLAVPRVLEALDKSKLNSGISLANEVANAMERYAAQNGEATVVKYPAEADMGTYEAMLTVLKPIASLPVSSVAKKYYLESAAGTIDFVYDVTSTTTYPSDWKITLKSTNNAADVICISPGLVQTKAAGSAC